VENTAFIALGSNIGNRYDIITNAIKKLTGYSGINLVNYSSIYETEPIGYEDQDLFLNMVIEIQTALSPIDLLDLCLEIELEFGRKREIMWGPRTLDLDILTFNQENIESEKLTVPHPRMLERAFVIIPLLEIYQDKNCSDIYKLLAASLEELPNKEGVRIWKRKNGEGVFEPIGS
jgi:2-amino-4-hydroxy-6-hydroxymethyldihydropteridine diphosphokinase